MLSSGSGEIWIVPFFGQGHLFPSMELIKHIASRNYKTTLIISSRLSNSIPASLRENPLLHVSEIPSSPPPPPMSQDTQVTQIPSSPPPPPMFQDTQMTDGFQRLLFSTRPPPICAIVDVMMSWTADIFKSFGVPTVGFFTSGACSAALEHAMWKADIEDIKPGEIRLLAGLPQHMAVTHSDLKTRPHRPPIGPPRGPGGPPSGPPDGPGPKRTGPPSHSDLETGPYGPHDGLEFRGPKRRGPPPGPGGQPPWVEEVKDTIGLMINTCQELEGPFIDYLANQMGKPVWGVGPLLPEQFYKSTNTLVHDREIRSNRQSTVTEDEVISWLDSKPRGSVLYVSFGTEVGPTAEEYSQLADALEATEWSFIWVLQPGAGRSGPPPPELMGSTSDAYFPDGLDKKVGERGMIIRGWAPQLLILSHPSTGGFLSHCGWNSTVEAIGLGVPLLAWPIRGDQYYNAKLVIKHLQLGYMISDDLSITITKNDIIRGVERLMGDEDMKQLVGIVSSKFGHGFPASSLASLDAFRDFIGQKAV